MESVHSGGVFLNSLSVRAAASPRDWTRTRPGDGWSVGEIYASTKPSYSETLERTNSVIASGAKAPARRRGINAKRRLLRSHCYEAVQLACICLTPPDLGRHNREIFGRTLAFSDVVSASLMEQTVSYSVSPDSRHCRWRTLPSRRCYSLLNRGRLFSFSGDVTTA